MKGEKRRREREREGREEEKGEGGREKRGVRREREGRGEEREDMEESQQGKRMRIARVTVLSYFFMLNGAFSSTNIEANWSRLTGSTSEATATTFNLKMNCEGRE